MKSIMANFVIKYLFNVSLMYQSIPSLTIPQGKPLENCLERANSPPPEYKEIAKSRSLGQKNCAKTPPPGQLFKKNSAKNNTKHEIKFMENSTEMLICLENNIKTVKHTEAQSFLVGGWVAFMDIKNISDHSPFNDSSINQHKKFVTSMYQNTTLINKFKNSNQLFLWFPRLATDQEYPRE